MKAENTAMKPLNSFSSPYLLTMVVVVVVVDGDEIGGCCHVDVDSNVCTHLV